MFAELKSYPAADRAAWTTRRLGAVGSVFKANGGAKEDDADLGVPCIRYGDLYTRYGTAIRRVGRAIRRDVADRYTELQPGDLLFAASGETIEDIGRSAVNLVEGEVRASGDIVVCRPGRDVNPEFLALAVDTPAARQQKAANATGTMIVHITSSAVKTLRADLPPLEEQAAIVKYLAHAHHRIDRAIAAKRKLIALLEEQGQATTASAFRPLVGDWSSVGAAVRVQVFATEVDERAGSLQHSRPLLSVSIRTGVRPREESTSGVARADTLDAYKLCGPGDLVLNRMRAFQGAVGVSRHEGIVSPDYLVARLDRGVVELSFVEHLVRSAPFVDEMSRATRGIGSIGTGGSRTPRVNPADFLRIKVNLPSLAEQSQLVARLDLEMAASRGAIDRAHREIDLLREFRTRLTADVVTGQVDVRHIAATLPDLDPDELTAGQCHGG